MIFEEYLLVKVMALAEQDKESFLRCAKSELEERVSRKFTTLLGDDLLIEFAVLLKYGNASKVIQWIKENCVDIERIVKYEAAGIVQEVQSHEGMQQLYGECEPEST